MRDYQRQKNNKYILPQTVYHQTLWIIRDYDRMCEELSDILDSSPSPPDGTPKGQSIGGICYKAEKREHLLKKVQIIEDELLAVPEEFRQGVWFNIQRREAFPLDAGRSTYARYKSKLIFNVAKRMHLI